MPLEKKKRKTNKLNGIDHKRECDDNSLEKGLCLGENLILYNMKKLEICNKLYKAWFPSHELAQLI